MPPSYISDVNIGNAILQKINPNFDKYARDSIEYRNENNELIKMKSIWRPCSYDYYFMYPVENHIMIREYFKKTKTNDKPHILDIREICPYEPKVTVYNSDMGIFAIGKMSCVNEMLHTDYDNDDDYDFDPPLPITIAEGKFRNLKFKSLQEFNKFQTYFFYYFINNNNIKITHNANDETMSKNINPITIVEGNLRELNFKSLQDFTKYQTDFFHYFINKHHMNIEIH